MQLEEYVSQYTTLAPTAKGDLKGRSPLAPEKTGSFYINPGKQLFHCFASGYSGDLNGFKQLERAGRVSKVA